MDKSKLMQRLMATFLEELEEHVRAFNQDLLLLEKNPPQEERAERFKTLFRTAHSLKGAARSVNIPLMEAACHRLEDVLEHVRSGERELDAELMALLFTTVDAIEEAGMRLREQQDLADAPLTEVLKSLEAAIRAKSNMTRPSVTPEAPVSDHASEHADLSQIVQPTVAENPRSQKLSSDHASILKGTPPVATSKFTSAAESLSESSTTSNSVRVSAEKLDLLLASVGELLVAQRRIEARIGELSMLQEFVTHWKTEWNRVESSFGRERNSHGQRKIIHGSVDQGTQSISQRTVGTLNLTGANIRRVEKELDRLGSVLQKDSRLLEQLTRPLNDEVHSVRMLPFSEACAGLDRMVRDLARGDNKEVDLLVEGGDVELDRSILEGLKDPLRHLIRNAVDHGIEPPEARQRAGKQRLALIKVSAALRGAQVEVIVQDDGRGLNLESIRAQAQRRKLEETADERDLVRLIFLPGFSTASIITDVSGRGVGLDVVKNKVESLHGIIDLSSQQGAGTRFTLNVPLTLTTLRVVLVNCNDQTYAFAGTNVQKMVHVKGSEIRTVAGREVLNLDGSQIPLASLRSVLHPGTEAESVPGNIPVVILVAGTTRMAFSVDELLSEQEILIKNLGARVRHVPLLAGATLLPSGRIALVLNAANLVRNALQGLHSHMQRGEKKTGTEVRKRILVVEDSVTTRTLMKSILEAAGYEVATAVDGQAGWDFLQAHDIDLVVSDVDMPHMNGFELTETIRGSKKFRELPLVLVTARESEADKSRGIAVGANGYLVKGAFDQRNLLETIVQLV